MCSMYELYEMRWDETECLNESNWLVLLVMFRNSGGLQIAIAVGSTALTYLAIKPTTWGQCGNRMQQGFISVGKGVKARCKLLVRWKKCKKRQYSNQKKVRVRRHEWRVIRYSETWNAHHTCLILFMYIDRNFSIRGLIFQCCHTAQDLPKSHVWKIVSPLGSFTVSWKVGPLHCV